ncbi:hypothetical protein F2P56_009295 [Juglans regia]|uniref:Uncharacterized protein LOC108979185 n=2 Tax=Juglans regia TaxID=51240 RepID=A0A6P9EMU2_JUGRE|nr:uncharacterized protein LOC108979185 [Juglans regia]XP_035545238.1 uncharacterized protein LOC108979185 [Juglans regia]KAF5472587.1 hypothetical protein F2P56_009295 [Juglans regia]
MGCISSKFVTRSNSFHEGQNQSLQRANDIPVLEEPNMSSSGSDHYLALVRTANMVAKKLQSWDSNSNTCSKRDIEPARTETDNKWELIASLDQGVVEHAQPAPKVMGSINTDFRRRSRSCHWSPEHRVSSFAVEVTEGIKEEKSYRRYKGMARSRSIHTVEEYDAMLENIRSGVQQRWLDGKDYGSNMQQEYTNTKPLGSETSSKKSYYAEDKEESGLQEMKQLCLKDEALVLEYTTEDLMRSEAETKVAMPSPNSNSSSSGQENREVIPSPSSSSSTNESHLFEGAGQEGRMFGKGFKRKEISEELESLRIPPNFELPTILSLREWLHVGGQVYSPGSHATPKYGSYSLPIRGTASECSEDFIFNPELVAAYEQCMHQLEAEEESVIQQIVEGSEEECTKDKHVKFYPAEKIKSM